MKKDKIKVYFILACLSGFILASFGFLFIDENITIPKFKGYLNKVKNYSKQNVGAIIYNNTNQTLEVTDYKYIHQLPPGKSTRDIGIFDVDSLILKEPMFFEDKIYSNGVLKFCDYSRIEVNQSDSIPEIKAQNTLVCKILNDFNFYNSIDEAFH